MQTNDLTKIKTLVLWKMVGGLSVPSKMPCHGYSIPAKNCQMGGKLHKVVGSVCKGCYARKGNYMFPVIQKCLQRRQDIMESDPAWVINMAELINRKEYGNNFRWFDSGDLQSAEILKKIVDICNLTPTVKHWLPTKEYGFVKEFKASGGIIPDNLNIRLSAYMIDVNGPNALAKTMGVTTSSVSTQGKFTCPASKQNNECRTCRNCWDKNVAEVIYKKH